MTLPRKTEQPPFYFCGKLVPDIEAWSAARGEKLVEVLYRRGDENEPLAHEVETTYPQIVWEGMRVMPGEILSAKYRDPHA
jgi:hypothetical protein